MLKDLVKKYRDVDQYDLSCSETMIYAANEIFDLKLDKNTFRAMAPFAGGLLQGDVCGALTGAYAVLGILYTNKVSHDSDEMREICKDYYEKFNGLFTTNNCTQLKETLATEEEGCDPLILGALELLVETIEKNGLPS